MDRTQINIIPSLVVHGADEAIAFYQRVFGAQVLGDVMRGPGGRGIMHAELQIGNSMIFLSDEYPEMQSFSPKHFNGTPITLHLSVADVDKTYEEAVAAGAKDRMPPADMFWGDRYAQIIDPWGHLWSLSTPKEKLTQEQLRQRAEEFVANMKR